MGEYVAVMGPIAWIDRPTEEPLPRRILSLGVAELPLPIMTRGGRLVGRLQSVSFKQAGLVIAVGVVDVDLLDDDGMVAVAADLAQATVMYPSPDEVHMVGTLVGVSIVDSGNAPVWPGCHLSTRFA